MLLHVYLSCYSQTYKRPRGFMKLAATTANAGSVLLLFLGVYRFARNRSSIKWSFIKNLMVRLYVCFKGESV